MLRGHVVDFIQLPHFAIFNVADMCITSAAVLIMVLSVVKNVAVTGERYQRAGKQHAPPRRTAAVMPELKVVLIPEGLDGERVDVAVARMLGLSRSKIIDLIQERHVLLDGVPVAKSDRARTGSMLEVTFPEQRDELAVVPQAVPGLDVLFDDDHIVVIDKPVGVAAHPSLGWSGPSVLGHLAAAGVRVSTSGVPERQGIVQRLDVGTSGLMVVAKSELAYTVLKRAFRSRAVEKTYHALVQGHPDPFTGTIDAPIGRHPGADYKMAVIGRRPAQHHPLRDAGGLRRHHAAGGEPRDWADAPDPGALRGSPAPVRR